MVVVYGSKIWLVHIFLTCRNACVETRSNSVPFCTTCENGLSELMGSSQCGKCSNIGWIWFLMPLPFGIALIFWLLRKDYGKKGSVVFTLVSKNVLFFYQIVDC